ncbi:MAG: hypothetical protein R6V02_09145 [Candidatus Aminicenantes bacterium]
MKIFKPKEVKDDEDRLFIEEEDVFNNTAGDKGSSLMLGKYTIREAGRVLNKRNFYRDAKKRNLWPVEFELDSSQFPPIQRLLIYFQEKHPEKIIVDLKIREGVFTPKRPAGFHFSKFRFLVLEWLTLQNPRKKFSEEETPLPGQKHPGLNLGRKIIKLFIYLARLNHNDGILAFPAYFHNALLFSRNFHFVNPEKKAEVEVIRKSFPGLSFKPLAWAVHLNCLKDREGKTYEWNAEEQMLPLKKELKDYFESKKYKRRYQQALKEKQYTMDWPRFRKEMKKISLDDKRAGIAIFL